MDKALRNELRHTVTDCRRLLEDAIEKLLEGQFGIHPKTGAVEDAVALIHLSPEDQRYRAQTVVHLGHIRAAGFTAPAAVAQLVRETAFTHLNRLCAFKIMEEMGQREKMPRLLRESVSKGVKSPNFLFYLADHPDDEALRLAGSDDVAYRHFLLWLCGQFAAEIPALFSPQDPANRLFPPQRVLDEVLELLNRPALADIWEDDAAIGWIYQYFTPKELRDEARKKHPIPQNSYELAFRNQFYTPRYVVRFLVDNTLGRLWYEMRQGDTTLKTDRILCPYLVYRPQETFLASGESEPAAQNENDVCSSTQPVPIRLRIKKDPRELRIIDPACGSGHFLLGCFDLLETIYSEAYTDPDLSPALQRDYPTFDSLRCAVPSLILRHNLHGIDIDRRATQIAALALWLRAQRTYQSLNLRRTDRPPITRSNIVCAEPMPGEADLLEDFLASDDLRPSVLAPMVRQVFEKMRLAGEVGALLQIEKEIRNVIADTRRRYHEATELAADRRGNIALFPQAQLDALASSPDPHLTLDFSGLTDADFFDTAAEPLILDALQRYATRAAESEENGDGLQRQLFAEDAAHGFAFVDLCQKPYDVVLMNPPFGAASAPSQRYIDRAYPRTKNDLYAAFVERWAGRLVPRGMLGAITSRTGFFLTSFQRWREEILLKDVRPTIVADLGAGVLDTAMVETAAYCLEANV